MKIGRLWRAKRPRNDLDEYLAEVDEHLFCVSRADRRCLHRDLKAHVRELTTDERSEGQFDGRYAIDDKQLKEIVGEPTDISDMYVRSVRSIPSPGMRIFLAFASLMAFYLIFLGTDSLRISGLVEDDGFGRTLYNRGIIMIISGIAGMAVSVALQFRYQKLYFTVPFLCLYMVLIANPICLSIARDITRRFRIGFEMTAVDWLYPLLLIETSVVVALGLYLALKHYRAFQPDRVGLA